MISLRTKAKLQLIAKTFQNLSEKDLVKLSNEFAKVHAQLIREITKRRDAKKVVPLKKKKNQRLRNALAIDSTAS